MATIAKTVSSDVNINPLLRKHILNLLKEMHKQKHQKRPYVSNSESMPLRSQNDKMLYFHQRTKVTFSHRK
jgi:hypothetical protein